MIAGLSKPEEINVLASQAGWAWPEALNCIFRPRGVNLLVAEYADDFVNIIERRRIHTAIIDMDSDMSVVRCPLAEKGLAIVKVIRNSFPSLPCIMLTGMVNEDTLGRALELEVFSVIDKPVQMNILREQLNRLFLKKYDSDIFA